MKKYNEQEVLSKLDISDWSELAKDKIREMMNIIDDIDPKVLSNVMEMYPEIMNTIRGCMTDSMDIIRHSMHYNHRSNMALMEMCKSTIKSLDKMIESGNYSFEQNMQIIDVMRQVSEKAERIDIENKVWQMRAITNVGGILACVLAVAVGGVAIVASKGKILKTLL